MSKQNVTNTWTDGLNKDLNPIVTPNTVLTDNLNGTFITYNGNELSLQNDMGNVYKTSLSDGFYPIGMSEYGGIIYIASVNNGFVRYIKITDDNQNINSIYEAVYEKQEDTFSITDAISLFSDKGWPVTTQALENIVISVLEDLNHTYEIFEEASSKFELGCFPSLPTDGWTNNIAPDEDFDFESVYRPLYNLVKDSVIGNFTTTALGEYDTRHPVNIEVQPSYDGSVNLLINDNKNIPRLINSGFAVLENGKGRFIKRNQDVKTNYYEEATVEQTTHLINSTNTFPKVDLGLLDGVLYDNQSSGVQFGGQLKGGNYTFYFKLGDEDGNKTDIVCESGIVSIFKGTPGKPNTISGAFYNEQTDKSVTLTVSNLDTTYSRLYVYYTREYCDMNGYRLVEAKSITEPYKIDNKREVVVITGLENSEDISVEELNVRYYNISSAKTFTQQQNMLFLGNVETQEVDSEELQNLSYNIEVKVLKSESIGRVDKHYIGRNSSEYYDPYNVYYKLGYWPNEIYRFGIVYIKNDGSLTSVYNLRGCSFNSLNESNLKSGTSITSDDGIFINDIGPELYNLSGVFKTPDVQIITSGSNPDDIEPLCFNFNISNILNDLINLDIAGYFIVRQKRIPMTLCQGFSVGVNKTCFAPMLPSGDMYYMESFVTENGSNVGSLEYEPLDSIDGQVTPEEPVYYWYLVNPKKQGGLYSIIGPGKDGKDTVLITSISPVCESYLKRNKITAINDKDSAKNTNMYNTDRGWISPSGNRSTDRRVGSDYIQKRGYGLVSLDAIIDPEMQSKLCGTKFELNPVSAVTLEKEYIVWSEKNRSDLNENTISGKLIYIPENTSLKYVENVGFSTKIGDGINVSQFGAIYSRDDILHKTSNDVIRGHFTPFIGCVTENDNDIKSGRIYNIRVPHDASSSNEYYLDFLTRANNNSLEFYAVSNRTPLSVQALNVFRGDCFTNTITIRMHRNFVDQTAPIADKIVKTDCWKYFKGVSNVNKDGEHDNDKTDWSEINVADLNTVSLGHWLTFKCLSNINLGLRSEDTSNVTEMSLLGNPRSFYPLVAPSTKTGMKVADSALLNNGYGATVSRIRNTLKQKTSFDKNEFSTRIMFSNVSITDSFINGYRVFQGLSYHDYTKQFGSIVKLLPWGNNLFCVFEHGLAIVPVNEKALMQTTTEQTIHIYGHGVLSDQLSIISQDFGSIWADSVIKTPVGIYGVDSSAKKIWKFTDKNGLETISDLKLQRFLNDNMNLGLIKQEHLGFTNIKSHFNNYKGDVMFTFYNGDVSWNLCYNERQSLWVTRYSWIPIFSANIDNSFYSIDKNIYSGIWQHGRTKLDAESYKFRPTLWYGQQHPFEFEFVVKDPVGLHKVFEDLVIISNNVQPYEIEFEFIGDDYLFNRARIYHDYIDIYGRSENKLPYDIIKSGYNKNIYNDDLKSIFYNATINYDPVLDEHTLVVKQRCKNIETYGRRLGNIQYKEDGWYTNIEPLRYNIKLNDPKAIDFSALDQFASAKLRDKWIKIRLRYTGDQLAIVSGVTTFENLSYA